MNSFPLVLGMVCLVLQANAGAIDKHLGLRNKCLGNIGLSDAKVAEIGTPALWANPEAGCYLKCILEGINVFKDDNSLDIELSVASIDEKLQEQSRPLVTKCINDTKDVKDKCELSFKSVKCLADGGPAVFNQLGLLEPPRTS